MFIEDMNIRLSAATIGDKRLHSAPQRQGHGLKLGWGVLDIRYDSGTSRVGRP